MIFISAITAIGRISPSGHSRSIADSAHSRMPGRATARDPVGSAPVVAVGTSLGARQPDGGGAATAGGTGSGTAPPPVILVVASAAERHALRGLLDLSTRGARQPGRRVGLRLVRLLQAGIGRERARQAVIAAAGTFGAQVVLVPGVCRRPGRYPPAGGFWSVPASSWTLWRA